MFFPRQMNRWFKVMNIPELLISRFLTILSLCLRCSCVVYEPLDRYVGRHLDRHIGRYVGRHIDRRSTDMSVDIATDISVEGCWSSIGRYVDRYVDRYVGRYVDRCSTDTSVDIAADIRPIRWPLNIGRVSVVYRSSVGGLSVACLIIKIKSLDCQCQIYNLYALCLDHVRKFSVSNSVFQIWCFIGLAGPIFFFPFVTKDPNLWLKQRKNFVSHTEQPSSVPVVCNKACVYSRYAETSIFILNAGYAVHGKL